MEDMEYSSDPVVFSHSNARALCDNPRNIRDDQIETLAKKDGVIGINAFPAFVSKKPEPTVQDFLGHIDYIADLVGTDHVGIGSDFLEGATLEEYKYLIKSYKPEAVPKWPWVFPEGIRSVSDFPNITKGLVDKGYSEEEIKGILGGNFLRVFKQVWKD
jgi:membrane dipeptidase